MSRKTERQQEYATLLQRPEWRERRLDIIRREEVCARCGSMQRLEVHHLVYREHSNPWEYSDGGLRVFCHTCHGIIHKQRGAPIGSIPFDQEDSDGVPPGYKAVRIGVLLDRVMAGLRRGNK